MDKSKYLNPANTRVFFASTLIIKNAASLIFAEHSLV